MSAHTMLIRVLIRMLPSWYDAADRTEMLAHLERRLACARRERGRIGALRVLAGEVMDLAVTVARAHAARMPLDGLLQDLRFGVRSLLRRPLVSGLAATALALGIGATTAVFSVLDVWLIRPLPLPEPDRLVSVAMANRGEGWSGNPFTPSAFEGWAGGARSVALAAYRTGAVSLALDDRTERVETIAVTDGFLDVVGYRLQSGRPFAPEEHGRGERVVIVSDGFWRRALGAAPDAVGRSLGLDGRAFTVIGVLEAGAGFAEMQADLWLPYPRASAVPGTGHVLSAIGRLADGATLADVRTELDGVARAVADADAESAFPDAQVGPLREAIYGDVFEQGGSVLGAAALFVLLIACADIASLLLARAAGRGGEIAIRGALGAGRARIVRQLLVESAVLAAVGGAAGLGLAWIGIDALVTHVLPPDVPGWHQIGLDGRVLVACITLTGLSILLFGLVPALRTTRGDGGRHPGARGLGRPGAARGVSLLVAGEVALSLALLASTTLLIGTLVRLHAGDPGFRVADAVTFRLHVPATVRSGIEDVEILHHGVHASLASVRGAASVAASSGPAIGRWSTTLYSAPGAGADGDAPRGSAEQRVVTPGYFETMGMRLVAGRDLSAEIDPPDAPPVAVVSRVLAVSTWGSEAAALGRSVEVGDAVLTVVGVVEAGRMRGPHLPAPPVIFRSLVQRPARSLFYVVAGANGGPALGDLREAVGAVEPALALDGATTLEASLSDLLVAQRVATRMLGVLAGLALALTLVGVYGVSSHAVDRRRREMGLRLALGAPPRRVLAHVLARTGRSMALGIAAGIGLAVGAGRLLSSALEGVPPPDAAELAGVSAVLAATVLVAAVPSARRAMRVDPADSFRD